MFALLSAVTLFFSADASGNILRRNRVEIKENSINKEKRPEQPWRKNLRQIVRREVMDQLEHDQDVKEDCIKSHCSMVEKPLLVVS